jgi:hypothetical protein
MGIIKTTVQKEQNVPIWAKMPYDGYNDLSKCIYEGVAQVDLKYLIDLLGLICDIKTGENGKSLNKVLADRIYDIGQFSQEGGHLNETRMRLFMLVQYLNAIKVENDVNEPSHE